MEKISILLPNLCVGGVERVAVNLANNFVLLGFKVDMVLMSCEGAFLSQLNPDVHLVDLGAKKLRNVLWPLSRYLRHRQPSALLACMWPLTVIAVWANWFANASTRVVVAEHTTWSMSPILKSFFQRIALRLSIRVFFKRAAGIIAVSQGVSDDLARLTGLDRRLITTIHNPIVANESLTLNTSENVSRRWWNGAHRRVLAVGTLKEIKDFPTLLRAFTLVREIIDVKLLILGEGPCRNELESLIIKLGLSSVVEMAGFVSNPSPYYQHADLHVLSSLGEGLPTVIIEALAAGTPVVSTDCPSGPREILEDGRYGRLVPVGDVKALAAAMITTLQEPVDKIALQTRAQDFSVDKIAKQYLKVLFPEAGP